jgi:subtilase family serine protease
MSMSRRASTSVSLLLAAIGCLLCQVPGAGAAPTRRVGSAPRLPGGATAQGTVAAGRELQLSVALEPRDPAALERFATEVSTPGSLIFREYVGVPGFASRFGAPADHVAAVEAALRAQGLKVGDVAANHLTLPVSGSAAAIEGAFATPLAKVELPSGRSAYANTEAPAIAAGAAPYVAGVIGLDDLALPHPQLVRPSDTAASPLAGSSAAGNVPSAAATAPQVVTGGPQPCAEATAATRDPEVSGLAAFTTDQIAAAYQFSGLYAGSDFGAGQNVAVVEFEPYSPTDIAAYQACYKTAATVIPVNVAGGPGPYLGSDGEAALDIEQIIGLAPSATISVYQAPNTGQAAVEVLSAIVSQNTTKTISQSWAICEQFGGTTRLSAENTLLQEAAAQGQSFYASSGDVGSEACARSEPQATGLAVEDPASQPFATGVGGTQLTAAGPPPTERLWNRGTYEEGGATGGGLSAVWPMPTYQTTAAAGLGVVNPSSYTSSCAGTLCREVPDISADGDPYTGYVIYAEGEWQPVGGTSASAPLWAALTALVDAAPACRGRTVGFANPALYLIAGTNYTGNFHDVSAPSSRGFATNDSLSPGKLPFPVTAGYDMTTGLGSPIAPTLAASLCAVASPVYTVTVTPPAGATGTVGRKLSLQATGADSGNQSLVYSASGLPAGLTINPTNGLISGTPTKAGTATVTVAASDQFTNSGSTAFTLNVTRPKLKVKHAKLAGVAKGRPKLSLLLSAAGKSTRFSAVTLQLPKGLVLAKRPRTLFHGVHVAAVHGTRYKVKAKKGNLKLSFPGRQKKIFLAVQGPAVHAKNSFAKKVREGKVKRVKVKISASTGKRTTTVVAHLKVR